MSTLNQLGWGQALSQAWDELNLESCIPARVIADFGSVLKIAMPEERKAEISGRLAYESTHEELPKVGDWVAVRLMGTDSAMVEAVLPRKSEISRKVAGDRVQKQVLATNIDVAFVVQAVDHDFSPERMQRYLYQLRSDNIQPILVLNKIDKTDDLPQYLEQLGDLGIPIVTCSAKTGDGIDEIMGHMHPGQTGVLLGSSGVGKSTLINLLLGRVAQKTQSIRRGDSKGRHTTTHRELFALENGSLLIDTPGVRELQLWGSEEELDDTFADIAELILRCQFRNCSHTTEPGCAITTAIQSGVLPAARFENYLKMKRELQYLETKTDPEALRHKKKDIARTLKQHYKAAKTSPKYRPKN